MNLNLLTDEELDSLSRDIMIEKFSREAMRTMAISRADIASALCHVAKCTAFGSIEGIGVNFGGAITLEPCISEIKYTIEDEFNKLRIAPLDTEKFDTKTGFNPYPMFGVNPNDVFNKKKKRKRRF